MLLPTIHQPQEPVLCPNPDRSRLDTPRLLKDEQPCSKLHAGEGTSGRAEPVRHEEQGHGWTRALCRCCG